VPVHGLGLRPYVPGDALRINGEPERLRSGERWLTSNQCHPFAFSGRRPLRVVRPRDEHPDRPSVVDRARVSALGLMRAALSVEGALWGLLAVFGVYLGLHVVRALEVALWCW
jgi:hypothetical protein